MWTCPKCGNKVDPSFDVCWSCGTTADGVEDPTFVPADDAAPIYDDSAEDHGEGAVAVATDNSPGADLVECYQALSLMEAKFIADQLVEQGIPARADEQDLQDTLGSWEGNPRVYVRAEDLLRARAWVEAYDFKRKTEAERGH